LFLAHQSARTLPRSTPGSQRPRSLRVLAQA
jgi:hypothetical protein